MSVRVDLSETCSLEGFVSTPKDSSRSAYAFLGVPYAAPPIGRLRFQPPEPFPLWSGTRQAKDFGAVCIQDQKAAESVHFPFPFPSKMSEDCLFLNVWSPSLNASSCLPVMVWIHGGSYVIGFSNYYDGSVLASMHDVVFVSLNYRLGVLGFLCNKAAGIQGNMGLLDQLEAMKWVQRHISRFGGDPNNVTLFGESAGGISIASHMVSPLAKGLFHRAICQSGSVLYPGAVWSSSQADKFYMKRFRRQGLRDESPSGVQKFLQDLCAVDFAKTLSTCNHVMDGHFLSGDVLSLFSSGCVHPVDLIIGVNDCEGFDFVLPMLGQNETPTTAEALGVIDHMVRKSFFRGLPNLDAVIQLIREEYMQPEALLEGLCHAYGDLLFVAPCILTADLHAGKASTFVYQFCHRLSVSPAPSWCGARHGEEIPLVMGAPFSRNFPDVWTEEEKALSRTVMSYWTRFAASGDPNCPELPSWPAYGSSEEFCLLKPSPSTFKRLSPRRMELWNVKIPKLISAGKHKL